MSVVLFANSGSEANDSALKLIRYYWNLKGKPEKKIHLSRDYAYHGVTFAAASLSGLTPMHPQWDLPLARLREGAGTLLVRREGGRLRRHRAGRVRAADSPKGSKRRSWNWGRSASRPSRRSRCRAPAG